MISLHDSELRYILDIDLEYPTTLHDEHSDYPLAPESMKISNEMLSPFSQKLKENLQVKGQPTVKLIPNLHDKTKYITHYKKTENLFTAGYDMLS